MSRYNILFVEDIETLKMMKALIYSYTDVTNYSSPALLALKTGKCKMISSAHDNRHNSSLKLKYPILEYQQYP